MIFFALLVFGTLFVMRTLRIFNNRTLIRETMLTKIGTLTLSLEWISLFFTSHVPWIQGFTVVLVSITLVLVLCTCERREIDAHKSRVPFFLDRWILNMRLGQSVNAARDAALKSESEAFIALVKPCFDTQRTRSLHTAHPLFSANAMRELEELAHSPHCALERLENLRRVWRKSADFRRRSGQSLHQAAIQSAVMLVLLFALSTFAVHRYGWVRVADLVLGSALLSFTGVWLMIRMARKTRWTL
ncbi:MAG: hypothetical protein AB7G93_22235 [Bdellovibrionales bacterium]